MRPAVSAPGCRASVASSNRRDTKATLSRPSRGSLAELGTRPLSPGSARGSIDHVRCPRRNGASEHVRDEAVSHPEGVGDLGQLEGVELPAPTAGPAAHAGPGPRPGNGRRVGEDLQHTSRNCTLGVSVNRVQAALHSPRGHERLAREGIGANRAMAPHIAHRPESIPSPLMSPSPTPLEALLEALGCLGWTSARRLPAGGPAASFGPRMERVRLGCLARADSRRGARTPFRRRLIDVKSTTRLDEIFILDVPVQLSMLRGARLDVPDACRCGG